jgi:POT family proton-dependent oligopeptide transporter
MSPGLVEATPQKQPGALYLLFSTEAWERFSYYGMRAILVLYMTKALLINNEHVSKGTASLLYGCYTGLVYLTPLLGGFLADRFLGYRRSILIGGFIMAMGQFLLSAPAAPCFFAGLLCLIIGNGFFKPNISTIVGTLYEEGDPRRDRGFTIFYMGINLGAMFSPIVCGQLLAENPVLGDQGYAWGFRAAGIGMLIGLTTFFFGQRMLGSKGLAPRQVAAKVVPGDQAKGYRPEPQIETERELSRPLTDIERKRVLCLGLIGIVMVFFWMAFEQAGNSMTLFADERIDRNAFGWTMSASFFQFVNPTFILLVAPLISWVWKVTAARGMEPSTPAKMVLGLTFLSLGFVPLLAASGLAGTTGRASWVWLILTYFLHTIGELCLSPVGLSLVTKLAPKKYAALLMGGWFIPVFLGNFLAGATGFLYPSLPHTQFFTIFVVTSLAAAGVLLAVLKPLKGLMGGVH